MKRGENTVAARDGLYRQGRGREASWLYVREGVLWLDVAMLTGWDRITALAAGNPLTLACGHIFMRAGDMIGAFPHARESIEELAAAWGVAT